VAKEDQVLVRVHAAAVNIGDWHLVTGTPYIVRAAGYGLLKPKNGFPGTDVAGEVEATGENVESLQPGDEVFGWCQGAFAEYACAPEGHFLRRPAGLTIEQAAALGDSAFTALQALRDHGKAEPGQEVLINGASGGVGTFAVQIAKSLGANVTAVCSTRNAQMVRSIGADRVIDYSEEDFTRSAQRWNLIIDLIGSRSLSACRRALTPKGTYVLVGVSNPGRWFGLARQLRLLLLSPFVRQSLRTFIAKQNKADLASLRELAEAGELTPVIDRRYELSEAPEALRYQGEGHARGKIVVTV
jgi:NADPH:quinone reductase-like Zn-dependent oxidoreductase